MLLKMIKWGGSKVPSNNLGLLAFFVALLIGLTHGFVWPACNKLFDTPMAYNIASIFTEDTDSAVTVFSMLPVVILHFVNVLPICRIIMIYCPEKFAK